MRPLGKLKSAQSYLINRAKLSLLREYQDIFAWSYQQGLDTERVEHYLPRLQAGQAEVKKAQAHMGPERSHEAVGSRFPQSGLLSA